MSQILSCYKQHALGMLKDGTLTGYLLTDQDRTHVSEVCLVDPTDAGKMIKAYFSSFDLQTATFTLPVYEKSLNRELSEFAEWYQLSPANMYNIFDFAAVLEAFLTVKYHTYGLTEGSFSAVMGQPASHHQGIGIRRPRRKKGVRTCSYPGQNGCPKTDSDALWPLYGSQRSKRLVPFTTLLAYGRLLLIRFYAFSLAAKSAIASEILICCGQTASQLLQPMHAPGCLSSGNSAQCHWCDEPAARKAVPHCRGSAGLEYPVPAGSG